MKDEQERPSELRQRTKRFALQIIHLFVSLPNLPEVLVIGRQFLRSGTSVGAHYREACRARSDAEFVSKIEVGLQELDETSYWLELLSESGRHNSLQTLDAIAEADELLRIFVTVAKNVKER